MGTQKLTYQSDHVLPISGCQEVLLTLGSGWDAKTQSGRFTIVATVDNSPRMLGSQRTLLRPLRWDARNAGKMQYNLSIDDTQLKVDGGTSNPYLVACSDITEISPYPKAATSVETALDDINTTLDDHETRITTLETP